MMNLENVKIWVSGDSQSAQRSADYLVSLGYHDGKPDTVINELILQGVVGALYGDYDGFILYTGHNSRKYFENKDAEEISLPDCTMKAPPVGLRPKAIVDETLLQGFLEAMSRYAADGKKIDIAWIEELAQLNGSKQ